MGIIMLKDVQYGGVTQSEMETTLDDYQTKEDSGLETTSNEVVGAINELNSAMSGKQDDMSHGVLANGSSFDSATLAGYYSFSGSSYINPPVSGAIYGILHVMKSAPDKMMQVAFMHSGTWAVNGIKARMYHGGVWSEWASLI